MQSGSNNFYPPTDSVLWEPTFPHVFISGGVLFQTLVGHVHATFQSLKRWPFSPSGWPWHPSFHRQRYLHKHSNKANQQMQAICTPDLGQNAARCSGLLYIEELKSERFKRARALNTQAFRGPGQGRGKLRAGSRVYDYDHISIVLVNLYYIIRSYSLYYIISYYDISYYNIHRIISYIIM